MNGPLDGIRVLDFGIWQQGPVAAVFLGDMGADVIKVEERVAGDPVRGMQTIGGLQSGAGSWARNYTAEIYNRNKRGITLDLKKEKGKQVAYKLVEKADDITDEDLRNMELSLGKIYRMGYHKPYYFAHTFAEFGRSSFSVQDKEAGHIFDDIRFNPKGFQEYHLSLDF